MSARYLGAGHTFRLDPPRLRTTGDPAEERHATWFELFFDLVFAAALSQLASSLARGPSAWDFVRFAGLFVVVVWAWILYALYANRFDTDDLIFRLAKSGAMLAIAGAAVNLSDVMSGHGGTAGFALGYVVLRSLLIALYVRARKHTDGSARQLTNVYIVGYSATTAIWTASIWVTTTLCYWLWLAAMVADLAIAPEAWAKLKAHPIVVSHLTERFGTFFIIVLGRAVASLVADLAGVDLTLRSWVLAGLCFLTALCFWWIYFDLADTSVVGRGVLGLVYVYSHFLLLTGVGAFGVGSALVVPEAARYGLTAGARWALAGGVSAFALSLAALHIGAEWTSMSDRAFLSRLVLAGLALVLAVAGGAMAPIVFVGLLTCAVFGQLMIEALTPREGAATVLEATPPTPPRGQESALDAPAAAA
jgi:low temperature requirement protein LtrA